MALNSMLPSPGDWAVEWQGHSILEAEQTENQTEAVALLNIIV